MDLLQYSLLITQLNRLLDIKFIPTSPAYNSFLSLSIKSVIELFNKGDITTQKYEMGKLNFLVQSLLEIEQKRPDILLEIKKKMKKAIRNHSNYVGLRFEINEAYAFISKGIKIDYQDKPDFKIITDSNTNLFIECGSVHFFYEPKGDILDKLDSVINEKSSKPYADTKTGLFIDITNLIHTSIKYKIPDITDKIRKRVFENINKYGSVILFVYFADTNGFGCNYIRIDNVNIDHTLKKFLDKNYPLKPSVMYNYAIPNEG
jgi:hypothetical protein